MRFESATDRVTDKANWTNLGTPLKRGRYEKDAVAQNVKGGNEFRRWVYREAIIIVLVLVLEGKALACRLKFHSTGIGVDGPITTVSAPQIEHEDEHDSYRLV
ncbi:MAG TPA: hypothetical protein VF020_15210 [Chthoniobacterales bacterium]